MSRNPDLKWKVHTPNLLKEIMTNNQVWALKTPLQIFASLLGEVAARAIELDDPKLHALMLRLALYEQGDPTSADYDRNALRQMERAS